MTFIHQYHGYYDASAVYAFASKQEYRKWQESVDYIHERATTIDNARDFLFWLEYIDAFGEQFSKERVPDDIRAAANKVQQSFDLPITEWPKAVSPTALEKKKNNSSDTT